MSQKVRPEKVGFVLEPVTHETGIRFHKKTIPSRMKYSMAKLMGACDELILATYVNIEVYLLVPS